MSGKRDLAARRQRGAGLRTSARSSSITPCRGNGCRLKSLHRISKPWGAGVTASVNGVDVALGNKALMDARGIEVKQGATIREFEAQGKTVMLLAVNGTLAGGIALADRVRAEAAGVVAELQDMEFNRACLRATIRPPRVQSQRRSNPKRAC